MSGKRKKEKETPIYDTEAKLAETMDGTTIYNVPFPKDLSDLKKMSPIIVKYPYQIEYIHSYGQDSPFFAGLTNKKLLGTRCPDCSYTFATPKFHCMHCGSECDWIELPSEGRVHTYTTCYFGSEEFLKDTPFHLILVEFQGADTLLLTRLIGVEKPEDIKIGMKVRAKFRRLCKFKPTDVYFVPADKR
jgi:uncharacterized OB-fold protein